MRVKIGERWHDSNNEPICIQVSEGEQKQIANMNRDIAKEGKYAIFPDKSKLNKEEMFKWMSG